MSEEFAIVITGDDAAEAAAIGESVDKVDGATVLSGDEFDELAVDPVTAVLIGGGVLALSRVIMDWWQRFRGGTVIDLTTVPKDIRRDRDIDFGTIVVMAADGSVKIETHDEPKSTTERLLQKLLELPATATKSMIEAAKDLIKGDSDDDSEE